MNNIIILFFLFKNVISINVKLINYIVIFRFIIIILIIIIVNIIINIIINEYIIIES